MHDDEPVRLADALADRRSLDLDDQAALRLDLDAPLRQLAPRERAVLLARFVNGESAAEIGARYGRTEQTITAWLRRAVRQLQYLLQDHVSHHRLQHPSHRTPHHGPTHAATHVAAQHANLDTQQAAANR